MVDLRYEQEILSEAEKIISGKEKNKGKSEYKRKGPTLDRLGTMPTLYRRGYSTVARTVP